MESLSRVKKLNYYIYFHFVIPLHYIINVSACNDLFYTNFKYLKLVLINKLGETKFFVGNIFNLTLLNAKFLALKITMAALPIFDWFSRSIFFVYRVLEENRAVISPLIARLNETLCAICYYFYNLKKHEKLSCRNVAFSEVAGYSLKLC